MKKISLIALAVPALFAACSQDEIVDDVRNESSKELLGKVAGDVDFVLESDPMTRLTWTDGAPTASWENTDKFSLFWVGAVDANNTTTGGLYKAAANAVYYAEKGSNKFQSQSVVYEGNHIIVAPADLSHVTDKEIVVKVGAVQQEGKSIGDRTILVSDLLTIKAAPADRDEREDDVIYAGYGEPVLADVAPLTSNLLFNLTFGEDVDKNVKVEKVELIANGGKKPFVTEANLKLVGDYITATPVTTTVAASAEGGESTTTTATTDKLTVVFPEGGQTIPETGILPVHFSMLPSVTSQLADVTYTIKVYTNYGVVTVDKADKVYKLNDKNEKVYQFDGELGENEKVSDKNLGFHTAFLDNAIRNVKQEAGEGTAAVEAEEGFGKHTIRTVEIDMETADINGMDIKTSADLKNYYTVYVTLGKDKGETPTPATFDLIGENGVFVMTEEAANLINETKYAAITLEADASLTTIKLENKDGKNFTAIPEFKNIVRLNKEEEYESYISKLVLELGKAVWTLNVHDAELYNQWKSIKNSGDLTISQVGTPGDGKAPFKLTKAIENAGDVDFSGTVVLPVNYTQSAGTTTIDGTDDVTLNGVNKFNNGTLTVDAPLFINGETTVAAPTYNKNGALVTKAVVNVKSYLLTDNNTTFTNLGELNFKSDDATVIITNNGNGTVNGTINLSKRNNNLNLGATYKGYIKWECGSLSSFKANSAEHVNYLIVTNNIQLESNIDYMEVDGNLNVSTKNGNEMTVGTLIVNSGKIMTLNAGSKLKANNSINNGRIVDLGTYTKVGIGEGTGSHTGSGTIYKPGQTTTQN